MSQAIYSFDPCVRTGAPCGACNPYTRNPGMASHNDLSPCSVCPGGGCSPCPAPVRPFSEPPPPCPHLPWLPPCPPCDKPAIPVPPKTPPDFDSIAIPYCRPNRKQAATVAPSPCYYCCPKRCSFPGVPVCRGCCGPCMPVW